MAVERLGFANLGFEKEHLLAQKQTLQAQVNTVKPVFAKEPEKPEIKVAVGNGATDEKSGVVEGAPAAAVAEIKALIQKEGNMNFDKAAEKLGLNVKEVDGQKALVDNDGNVLVKDTNGNGVLEAKELGINDQLKQFELELGKFKQDEVKGQNKQAALEAKIANIDADVSKIDAKLADAKELGEDKTSGFGARKSAAIAA